MTQHKIQIGSWTRLPYGEVQEDTRAIMEMMGKVCGVNIEVCIACVGSRWRCLGVPSEFHSNFAVESERGKAHVILYDNPSNKKFVIANEPDLFIPYEDLQKMLNNQGGQIMDNIDWSESEVPEDATHVRVAGDRRCYYKGITEGGGYFYMNPFRDKWEQGRAFPIGWFEGELIKRPDTQKLTSLLNTKIDLRKEDGTIDTELSKAFQEACFEQGIFWKSRVNLIEYQLDFPFLYVIDGEIWCGATDYAFKYNECRQINFKYTRKLEWEATEVDVTPKVDLTNNEVYMFDYDNGSEGMQGAVMRYNKAGDYFFFDNTMFKRKYCTNIKRLVPENIE